jgi:YesN/AraC family two-component response regulator
MIRLKSILNEDLFGTSLKMKPYEALMVKSVVSFMMDKYNFNSKIIVKKKDKTGLIGDISLNSNSVNNNKFYLHFNPNQSYKRIIQSMIHELTHVKQVAKKELLPNKDYTSILWKGKEYITAKDYNKLMKSNPKEYVKLPWEIEANNNMNNLYSTFINSKYWKDLKGKDTTLDYIIDNI